MKAEGTVGAPTCSNRKWKFCVFGSYLSFEFFCWLIPDFFGIFLAFFGLV
jgi:hypothetical protein